MRWSKGIVKVLAECCLGPMFYLQVRERLQDNFRNNINPSPSQHQTSQHSQKARNHNHLSNQKGTANNTPPNEQRPFLSSLPTPPQQIDPQILTIQYKQSLNKFNYPFYYLNNQSLIMIRQDIVQQPQNSQKYSIFCSCVPFAGHSNPLLKIIEKLFERGHKIIYATSYYEVEKLRKRYPEFQYVELHDDMTEEKLKTVMTEGPPMKHYHEVWIPELRKALEDTKPDVVFADFFSTAVMELAGQMNLKLVINAGLPLSVLPIFGIPNYTDSFGFFGITAIKPSLISLMFRKKVPLIGNIGEAMSKHLVLVSSFIGFDPAMTLPPNIKPIGWGIDGKEVKQEFPNDLQKWLQGIQDQNLDIVYVTFGSHAVATKEFVNYFYFGLKKTGKAVIWSLKQHEIPEQNQLFWVKPWLPQRSLLQHKSVKVVITHGGFGGLTESIQALKPVLVMPCFGDQPLNARRCEQLGLGLILRPSESLISDGIYRDFNFTHDQLSEKINKVISDPQYTTRIRKIKDLGFQLGGLDKGCDWIESAAKNGYTHLIDSNHLYAARRNPLVWLKRVVVVAVLGGLCWKYQIKIKDVIETVTKK